MSNTVTPTTRRSSARTRIALVIAGLLALGDLSVSIGELGQDAFQPVTLIVLAALTIVAIPFAWMGASWARATVAATRVLAALTVVPAFFDGEHPAVVVIIAAIWLVFVTGGGRPAVHAVQVGALASFGWPWPSLAGATQPPAVVTARLADASTYRTDSAKPRPGFGCPPALQR